MSIRRVKVNGRKVWQARYRSLRKSAIRESKEEARQAETELLGALRASAESADAAAQQPATLKALLEAYAADLTTRGKGDDTLQRAASTALAIERLMPALLEKPIGDITDADVFAFRAVRAREGK